MDSGWTDVPDLSRDQDSAADTFLGIRAVVLEILQRLPGTRVLLTGILPRGPALGMLPSMPPAPGESNAYIGQGSKRVVGSGDDEIENNLAIGGAATSPSPSPSPSPSFSRKFAQPGVHTRAIDEVNSRLAALAHGSGGMGGREGSLLTSVARASALTLTLTLSRQLSHSHGHCH